MKIHTANALLVLAALLPLSIVGKKDSPHRIFHTTRSKAAKSQLQTFADASAPLYDDLDHFVDSKAGKASGAKALKELLSKTHKAGKSECHKDEMDLVDFDLMLDLSSLSMATSMSYAPMGKSGKATSSKCYKSNEASEDDDWGYDHFWYDNYADVTAIIGWFLSMLAGCVGVELEFDSCFIQSFIEMLASDQFMTNARLLRDVSSLDASRKMEHTNFIIEDDDFWYAEYECETATDHDVIEVVDGAFAMCDGPATLEEYNSRLDDMLKIFLNETCICGYF